MKKKVQSILSAIIMMGMSTNKRLIAVLDFPADIEDFMEYADEVHDSMAAASYFGSSAAKLATLAADNTALGVAHTGVHSVPQTHTTAEQNMIRIAVQNDMRDLKSDVQIAANAAASLALSKTIIEAANMKAKEQGAINKEAFTVKDGPVTGTAHLVAKGHGHERYANDWGQSADGTNWTPIDPTLAADTIVTGLTKTSMLDFRHRYILKDGPTDWIYVYDWVVR